VEGTLFESNWPLHPAGTPNQGPQQIESGSGSGRNADAFLRISQARVPLHTFYICGKTFTYLCCSNIILASFARAGRLQLAEHRVGALMQPGAGSLWRLRAVPVALAALSANMVVDGQLDEAVVLGAVRSGGR
jgi:hypothetical protein